MKVEIRNLNEQVNRLVGTIEKLEKDGKQIQRNELYAKISEEKHINDVIDTEYGEIDYSEKVSSVRW